jgi:peptidoglycan/LPS O-acetylase OafA/YrhL
VFGIYRYGLAFCVAISHLWAGMLGGPAAYGVWGFYCLSGYLMTLILNEKYGFSPQGIATFAANRALRIYPAYYVVAMGMLVLFLLVPGTAIQFLPHLHKPADLDGWLYSLTLLTPQGVGALLHGSSALRVELWFYVFMAMGLARTKSIVVAWFLASCSFVGSQLYTQVPFIERYVFISSCSLAFSVGAMIYHFRNYLPVIERPWPAVAAAVLWWTHVWLSWKLPGGPWQFGLYTSLIFSAIATITLMRVDPKKVPEWLRKADRWAGNLSYPIYLCHWGIGVSVTWFFPQLSRDSFWVFVIAFPIVNLVSYAIYRLAEEPIQSWKLTSPRRSPVLQAANAAGSFRLDAGSIGFSPGHASMRVVDPEHHARNGEKSAVDR